MPTFTSKRRIRFVVRGFLFTVVLWALVLIFNWHARAHYPAPLEIREDMVLIALVIEFLTIKAFLLAVRTPKRDWLGWSLVAFNTVFAVYWLAVLEIAVLPTLLNWRPVAWGIKGAILSVTVWGLVELLRIDDPPPDDDCAHRDGLP